MDMFKLLARSTKIQKPIRSSKNATDHRIPSAGVASYPLLGTELDPQSHLQEVSAPRGTKRKRCEAAEDHTLDVSGALDFFGNGKENGGLHRQTTEVAELVSDGQEELNQSVDSTEANAPALSEEECRQILKQHKLKVTILEKPTELSHGENEALAKPRKSEMKRKKDAHTQLSPQPLTSFGHLRSKYRISKRLAANLHAQGYTKPTEVQMASLPLLLGSDEDRGLAKRAVKKSEKHARSEMDLLTIAPTGSGKTLGFMIPVIDGLLQTRQDEKRMNPTLKSSHRVQALIVAPTHELADQIVNEGRKLAVGTGIRISGLKKGMRLQSKLTEKDQEILESREEGINGEQGGGNPSEKDSVVKADIIVSTPLLLLHAISKEISTPASLPDVKFLVLDEADVLLDPLFREQTLGIWNACTNPSLRTSLWSATIGSSIETLAQSLILARRLKLRLNSKHHHLLRLVVGLKDTAIPNISHRLIYAASEQGKLLALRQLLHPSTSPTTKDDPPPLQPPFLIFTQTIPRAVALHSELLYDIPTSAGGSSRLAVLHSDISSTARSAIMTGFRKGEIWILITTDLLSRGIDFRGMNGVVNYDIPNTGASYVHRVGRTGRQGREGGVAVTLYTNEDIPYVKNVVNVIAASERANGKNGNEGQGVQKWLLDALPNVSKKAKRELKNKGVESRRVNGGEEKGKEGRKTRISTKSGYDRRVENKRKGAVKGSQRRREGDGVEDVGEEENDEWGGFDD